MENVATDRQVAVINNAIEIFRSAPDVLKANQLRTSKAKSVGESILEQWHSAWSIENEEERMRACAAADERSNKFLVNCATALSEEKESRAAITQMMDAFKKMFTEAEYELDRTKANAVTCKVQNNRDTYVQEINKIQERRRKEAERIANKAKEAIEIRTQLSNNYSAQYNNYLLTRKQRMIAGFNAITLDNFESRSEVLRTLNFCWDFQHEGPYGSMRCLYHNEDELKVIASEVVTELTQSFAPNFLAEMNLQRDELVEKLPSKLNELNENRRLEEEAAAEAERNRIAEEKRQEEIAKASAAKKKQLEEEARIAREKEAERLEAIRKEQQKAEEERRQREAEEEARLKQEAEQARIKSEQEAEAKKTAEQTMVLFEQEAAVNEVTDPPSVRQGYEIVVLHPVGYMRIFAHWFENEGKNLAIDKIGNTKLDQMKAWCEKQAHKTGEKIEDKFLRYEETFKAVNKKTK